MKLKPKTRAGLVLGVLAIVLPVLVQAAPGTETPAAGGTNKAGATESKASKSDGPAKPVEITGVHNAFQWSKHIYAGSCPEGEGAFKALAAMGIKTVVTVDGALPEVEKAKLAGLRYVHVPVGYSGIAREDALVIARAVRDLPGPVFIHCHHGKHRGPAAAAIAAIAIGDFDNAQAYLALKQSGTGANYKGLWADVAAFVRPSKAQLDAVDNVFPEKAKVAALPAQMVSVDLRWEHLGDVRKAGWGVPKDHPDIDPAHEALLLKEALTESGRAPESAKFPPDYLKRMNESEKAAAALEAALRGKDYAAAQVAYDAVKASCSGCHALYRDVKPQ